MTTPNNTPKRTRRKVSDKRLAEAMQDYEDIQDEMKPMLGLLEKKKTIIVEGTLEREGTMAHGSVQAVYAGETESFSYPKAKLEQLAKRSKPLRELRVLKKYKAKVSVKRKHVK